MTDSILTDEQESEARLVVRLCIERDRFGLPCDMPLRIYARGLGHCLRCIRHNWVAFGDTKPDSDW